MKLPSPLDRHLPELATLVPDHEHLAACSSCVMTRPAAPGRVAFTSPSRCCTHHPELPNFLVGQALAAGGIGAERIRLRLQDPTGVSRTGIDPSERYRERRLQVKYSFGMDAESTCPYWVEGSLGCSIHAHRNAVCRTWFCRLEHGQRSHDAWDAAKRVLRDVEKRIAERVAGDPGDDWEAYFLTTAERAEALSADEIRDAHLLELLGRASIAAEARDQPLPDCPVPWVVRHTVRDTHVELESISRFDPFFAPPWIFVLLSKLDGETPWIDALNATIAELEEPVSPDIVLQLWNRGLLATPELLEADGAVVDTSPAARVRGKNLVYKRQFAPK